MSVLTVTSILTAIIGGLTLGAVIAVAPWVVAAPRSRPDPHPLPPSRVAAIAFLLLALPGLVFWIGQVLETWGNGDPDWPRTVARGLAWFIFSAAFGAGCAVGMWWNARSGVTP